MKKRKKVKLGRIFIFIILLICIIYFFIKVNNSNIANEISFKINSNLVNVNNSKYKAIGEDTNKDYSGKR